MSFLNREIQLQAFSPERTIPVSTPIREIVDNGIEFTELPDFFVNPTGTSGGLIDLNINLTDDSILFDFSDSAPANQFRSASFNGYVFSDSSGQLPAFQNVTIDSSQTFLLLEESDIEFTEDTISVNAEGLFFNTNTFVKLDVEFEGDFVRFQNSNVPGTYLYATGEEAISIRNNLPGFVDEGIAFNAAIEPNDDLIPFYRFQNVQRPGTYLFVGEEERNSINGSPGLSSTFREEGVSFYVFGAGANQGIPFSRFQNPNVPGTYIYAAGEEAINIRNNFPSFIDEGVAFEI